MSLQEAGGETEGHGEVNFYKGGPQNGQTLLASLLAGNCSGLSTLPMLPLEYSLGEVQQVSQMFQMYMLQLQHLQQLHQSETGSEGKNGKCQNNGPGNEGWKRLVVKSHN